MFQGPDGFEKLEAPPATPPPPAVSKIAEDVYVLNGFAGGTHNIMFVAFNDYAGNKSFLEKTATVESSLLPKLSSQNKLKIELVENKKRVFQDDKHVVELYDIGPNPHANEILVAYLPKEKILFQADLLNAAPNGSIPIAQDATLSFSEQLEKLGLQVEKIYAVHGRATTPAELHASVEKRRASELKTEITGPK